MGLHDPVGNGGISMGPLRFSHEAAVSHEPEAGQEATIEQPQPTKKTRAPRKLKEG
jgi:hypothetical protein